MTYPHPHTTRHQEHDLPMALPSPASASSSTLVVTPLPSSSSKEKRLSLGLNLTISTSPQTQAKMGTRGFVQPHYSHLPRRTRAKTTNTNTNATPRAQVQVQAPSLAQPQPQSKPDPASNLAQEKEKTLSDTRHSEPSPQDSEETRPPGPGVTSSITSAAAITTTTPTTKHPASPSLPSPTHLPRPFLPHRAHAHDYTKTPPTHLLSLKLPPSPTFESGTTPAYPSAGLQLGLGLSTPTPAPVAPGSAPVHQTPYQYQTPTPKGPLHPSSANLPRRTPRTGPGARARAGTVPALRQQSGPRDRSTSRARLSSAAVARMQVVGRDSHWYSDEDSSEDELDAQDVGLGSGLGQAEEGGRKEAPGHPQTPTPMPGSARLLLAQRQRRHHQRQALWPRVLHQEAERMLIPLIDQGIKMEEERMCIQPVGRDTGVEVGFLAGGCGSGENDDDDFWGLCQEAGHDRDQHHPEGSAVDNDNDTEAEAVAEERRRQRQRQGLMRKVVLRVVMDSDSDSGLGLGSDDEHRDAGDLDLDPSAATGTDAAGPIASPSITSTTAVDRQPLESENMNELELELPTDLSSYKEGQTALTPEQMAEAFAFIGRHLNLGHGDFDEPSLATRDDQSVAAAAENGGVGCTPPSSSSGQRISTMRKKIRILAPHARHEDAMSLAVGYLTYSCGSSSSIPSSSPSTSSSSSSSEQPLVPSAADTDTDTAAAAVTTIINEPEENPYTPAHLFWMHLMDDGDGGEVDSRGPETADVNVDVVGVDEVKERTEGLVVTSETELEKEKEYNGIRLEWRGVLSYDGLERIDSAASASVAGPSWTAVAGAA